MLRSFFQHVCNSVKNGDRDEELKKVQESGREIEKSARKRRNWPLVPIANLLRLLTDQWSSG